MDPKTKKPAYYIYNHMEMYVQLAVAPEKKDLYQVVGFAIEPQSISHELRQKASSHAMNFDIREKDQIGEYLQHEVDESGDEPQ